MAADQNFRREMVKLGFLSYSDQDTLYSIAKQCAKKVGIPMGAGGLVVGANIGAVSIPLVGTIPGAVAGFLAGVAGGTMTCTIAHYGMRPQLRRILDEQ